MGKYNGAIVTTVGQNLIANAVASNRKIIFTKLKASTHVYASTTDFESMTSIADIVQSVDISYAGVYNNNVIQVSGRFTNNGVVTPFTINTIGLYGKVGSGNETLVAVVTAVNADTMPVADPVSPTSIIYNIQMTVQNSGVMEVEVNDAGTINVHQFNDALYSTAAITVPTTGWTASGSQYTKTIDVGGITSSSMPFVELQYPDNVTATQKKAIDKAASKLVSLTTTNYGQVVLTATEVPATSFNLLLRGLGSGQYTQPYNEFFTTVLDKEPYVSRTARDGLVKIPNLVGATVAWNQLLNPTRIGSQTNAGLTATKLSDTKQYSITGTATDGNINIWLQGSYRSANALFTIPVNHVCYIKDCNIYAITGHGSADIETTLSDNGKIFKTNNIAPIGGVRVPQAVVDQTYDLTLSPQLYDLTQMFGTEIADYIYSLETAEAGSGIAYLKSYGFFKKLYYGYDPGSLQSVCTSARKITALDGTIRNYPIENVELRGLFKLDSNNKLYADGDIYPSSGSGTRKYGIVDLGTLTWQLENAVAHPNTFLVSPPSLESSGVYAKPATSNFDLANIICVTYITNTQNNLYNELADKSISLGAGGALRVRDSSYTDAATFKSAMNGVYLVYELATPTTFSADPYINPQRSEGTEEFVDGLTRDVMIPVGNESTYYLSEVLPSAADYTDARVDEVIDNLTDLQGDLVDTNNMIAPAWSATETYTKNTIVRDGGQLYKAKSDVPTGTVTSNTTYWEITTTSSELKKSADNDLTDNFTLTSTKGTIDATISYMRRYGKIYNSLIDITFNETVSDWNGIIYLGFTLPQSMSILLNIFNINDNVFYNRRGVVANNGYLQVGMQFTKNKRYLFGFTFITE